jgi:hypothetical protein
MYIIIYIQVTYKFICFLVIMMDSLVKGSARSHPLCSTQRSLCWQLGARIVLFRYTRRMTVAETRHLITTINECRFSAIHELHTCISERWNQ